MMGRPPFTPAQRDASFLSRCAPPDANGCVLWTGHVGESGYAEAPHGGRAHRYAWIREHGPIPEGFETDHWRLNEELAPGEEPLCARHCVAHLRLVPRYQNSRLSPRQRRAAQESVKFAQAAAFVSPASIATRFQ